MDKLFWEGKIVHHSVSVHYSSINLTLIVFWYVSSWELPYTTELVKAAEMDQPPILNGEKPTKMSKGGKKGHKSKCCRTHLPLCHRVYFSMVY